MKRRSFLLANLAGAACAALGIKVAKAEPKLRKTDIFVYANGKKVGAIKTCTISETHGKPLRVSTERIRFDHFRVKEAFDSAAVSVATQKRALEVRIVEDWGNKQTVCKTPPLWLRNDPLNFVAEGFIIASTFGPCSSDHWLDEPIILEELIKKV